MNTFAVIPAYNESIVIASVIKGVKKYVDSVIVIDDGSSDDTADKARSAGAVVIKHIINRGQGAALQTGTDYALTHGAEIIVHFDADGQMDPSDIPFLCEPIQKGECDIVLGSRFLNAENSIPKTKKIIHLLARRFDRIISGINSTDVHCGFRCISFRTAQRIRINHDRMAHATEILENIARNNFRFKEIPITVRYTAYSRGKAMPIFTHIWQILRDIAVGKLVKR